MYFQLSYRVITFQLVATLWIATYFFGAQNVSASTCCAGGGGQSVCVLPSEQKLQLGVTTALRLVDGHFDPYGKYVANSEGTSSTLNTTTIGSAYRLGEDWQAGLGIPIVTSRQQINWNSRSSTAIADPVAEVRYTLWEDLAFLPYQPQLSFYGGLRTPLGPSVYSSSLPTGFSAPSEGVFIALLIFL